MLLLNNQSADAPQARQLLTELKTHHYRQPADAERRKNRINRAIELLVEHQQQLVDAYSQDFGFRSPVNTLVSDILGSIDALKHARDHLADWMGSEQRPSPFPGTRALIDYCPVGVVGIISPWNFPLVLTFAPLAGVLAAGNSAMIKPSELTPRGSALLCRLIADYFTPMEISTVQGDQQAGALFSSLPLDHLVFTGSTATGKHIMRAAAENLTPVTLELGGKSPVILSASCDLPQAVARIMTVKTFNAGQICIAPDYVLLPAALKEEFIALAREFVRTAFPDLQANDDYTAIINPQHYQRINHLVTDAVERGARAVVLNPADEQFGNGSVLKMPPTLLTDVPADAAVLHEEIFGPVLPLVACDHVEQAIDQLASQPHPLAAYYFGDDQQEIAYLRQHMQAGALVINDCMTHVLIQDLPFGGVGASGIGAYHGIEGFKRFSHARPLLIQSPEGHANLAMRAPYGEQVHALLKQEIVR